MENEEKEKLSLKKQSAWLLFAKIVGFGFALFLPLVIVRFLSQETVGVYRQVFLVVTNAAAILPLGISMSAYYFLSRETPERRSAAVFNILIFNFIVGGAAFLALYFFPQLLGNIFRNDEITKLAPKIGVVIWLWVFSAFLETCAIANQEAVMATAFIILAQFSKTAFMITAVFLFATVEAFVYAAIAQGAVQTVVLLIYLNSRFPKFWQTFDRKFFRQQLFYALPFGLAGLLWILQTDIHNYFVSNRFSAAEFAIYAYGCFQLPLIAMLAESVNAVLIPRMSQLQAQNDKPEMIRLTARAMQKLAFFYFPIYVFLMITAQVFIVTLFTRNYLASVPIFMINLTILPFHIWMTDAVVRAYEDLGKFLLILRAVVIVGLVAALYFGVRHFDLRGIIATVVAAILIEKLVSTIIVLKKLEVKKRDIFLLRETGKTAVISLLAGAGTFLFYLEFQETIANFGTELTQKLFSAPKPSVADSISSASVLVVCFLVFAPVYLFGAYYFGVIDEGEKDFVRNFLEKISLRSKKTETVAEHRPLTTDN